MKKEERDFLVRSIPHYFNETVKRFVCGMMAVLLVTASVLPSKRVQAYIPEIPESTETAPNPETGKYATTEDADFDASKVDIIAEAEDLRTIDTKTFLKEDGTYVTAVYSQPVHFLSEGKFLDIDNTLSFNSETNAYTTKANAFGVTFPKSLDSGKKIKLTYGNYSIGWNLTDVPQPSSLQLAETKASADPKVLIKVNQSVSYPSIRDGVDVEYIVTGKSIKENIVLDRFVEDFSLSFSYSLENLSLVLRDDGTSSFTDENGKSVFDFGSLYMFDKEGKDSQNIKMTVKENGKGEYIVTIIPDSEWLKTAAYPVTIDPTIYNPYYNIPFEDTYVWWQYPDTQTYYNYSYFFVAYNTAIVRQMRGLLKFTLPNMSGKTLTYSFLKLYKYNSETAQRTIELHQNTSNFSENTVTWNTMPTYESDIVDYKVVNGIADSAYVFDITESVREWTEGISPNYGFTIKDQEDLGAYTRFYSSEHWLEFPVLEIGFIDSTGIKDFWTYASQDAGEAGTGYVSDYTGLLTWTRQDLSYSSERGSFGLTMVYNMGNRTSNIGYGLGWQTNYNMKVVFDTMSGRYYMVDATGSKIYFHLDGYIDPPVLVGYADPLRELVGTEEHATCYEAEDGSGQILMVKYNSSNVIVGTYVLNTDFSLYCFTTIVSNVYYLQYIENNLSSDDPYILTITRNTSYPDRITKIQDNVGTTAGQGNYISILYYTSGKMSSATLYLLVASTPTYRILQRENYYYTYCSSVGDYVMYETYQYKNYDGNSSPTFDQELNYSYDTYGRMTSAYESSGQKIAYTVNSTTDRVTGISSYYSSSLFSTVSYSYGLRTTSITDEDGNFVISKFDDYGHTVNLLDSQGMSQSFVYLNIFKDGTDSTGILKHADGSPNYDNHHKLAYSSDPLPTFTNPLGNPNFEIPYAVGGPWTLINGGGGSADPCTSSPAPQAGANCVKIATTSAATTYLSQSVVLDAGTYTLSGYLYIDSAFSGDSSDTFISFVPATNVYGSGSGTTETKGSWVLVSEYFVVETDDTTVEIRLGNHGIGSVCFDSIQLTSGFISTSGNLVENPSFEYVNGNDTTPGWTLPLAGGVSRVTNTYDSTAFASILGTYGIQMAGTVSTARILSGTRLMGSAFGSTEGNLIIGGWAKSNGTPITTQSGDVFPRSFRIAVTINYATEPPDDKPDYFVDFDPSIEGWQYNFISIPYDENTLTLDISLEYQGEGVVDFDHIQIYSRSAMTTYHYEGQGRTTEIIKPSQQTSYSYEGTSANDAYSRIPTSITTDGITTEIVSEAEIIGSVTFNNVISTPSHNNYGQPESVIVSDGSTTYYTSSTAYLSSAYYQYASSSIDEFGNTTDFYYKLYNGLLEAIENAKGQDTHYLYDEEGKLIEVRSVDDYSSSTPLIAGKVAYAYDSYDRLVKICLEYTDPASPTYYYEITYDDAGRMSSVKVNSTSLMTYTYADGSTDHSGDISTQTYANGDSIRFVYDEWDRVTAVQWWEGSGYVTRFSYEYDLFGKLNVFTEWEGTNLVHQEFYFYDGNGRIVSITGEDGNTTKYEYDDLGNVSKLSFVIDGVENLTEYSYDSLSRIHDTSYSTLASNALSREYDYTETTALERLDNIRLFLNNNTSGLYTKHIDYQTTTARITQISYDIWSDGGGDPGLTEYRYAYSFDELGNITEIDYFEGTVLIRKDNYEYDEMNQLIVEDIYQRYGSDYTYVYSYDSRGNRTSFSRYGYQRDGIEPADYALSYTYSQTWLDQLASNGIIINGTSETQDYVYDSQGNPTSITNFYYFDGTSGQYYDHATLTWEGRQLEEIKIYNASQDLEIYRVSTLTYAYNDQGYRTSKTISEPGQTAVITTYDLLGSQVIHESNGTDDIYYTYDSDGTLISFNLGGEDYFCLNNLQGDVVALIDEDGIEVASYEFDSYGNLLSSTGTVKSPLTYRGYRYDWEIGMYYLNSRYYNSQTGRFLNADGLLGENGCILSTNMYAYCANNPVMYTDSDGNFALLAILAYCIVVPLFLMATYALIEETRPILDPIMENITISVTGGTGLGADFANVGTFAGEGMAGFTCDLSGCSKVENSEQINLFIYTFTSQYENGELVTYEGWGFGPIMMVNDGQYTSLHLLVDFSTNIIPSVAMSFQVDIDLFGVINGYIELGKGWVE